MPEKSGRRPEPVVVTRTWDDLWLGVICLPNREIAGSPRNIYRYSVRFAFLEVEHWMALAAQAVSANQTPNARKLSTGSQKATAKRRFLKENSPDS